MNPYNYSYESLSRPYDNSLMRTSNDYNLASIGMGGYSDSLSGSSAEGGTVSGGSGLAGSNQQGTVSPLNPTAAMDNVTVKNWIKSVNYVPKNSGFYLDGILGKAYFIDGYFSGMLEASEIHIPDISSALSFNSDKLGNSWWGCNVASFNSNPNNAVSYILNSGNAKLGGNTTIGGNLDVTGNTRLVGTLTLGSQALQKSGKLVFEYYPSDGDTFMRAGKGDFGDDTNGFIFGIDQSDNGLVKFEIGDNLNYFKIDPVNGLRIRSNGSNLTGNSTIAGKLVTVLIAQTDTKEELILRPVDNIDEVEIQRADGTVVDIVQSMGSSGTPVYVTDYSLYGKDLTKTIFFEFEYSMDGNQTSKQVKLQADFNVIQESGAVNPAAFTGTVSQEFTVLNSGFFKQTIGSLNGTMKIKNSFFTANTNLIQIRLSRQNTGLIGSNNVNAFRIHRARIYMTHPDWSNSETYVLNDVIVYIDGRTYKSLQNGNLNHIPSSSPTWWIDITV